MCVCVFQHIAQGLSCQCCLATEGMNYSVCNHVKRRPGLTPVTGASREDRTISVPCPNADTVLVSDGALLEERPHQTPSLRESPLSFGGELAAHTPPDPMMM